MRAALAAAIPSLRPLQGPGPPDPRQVPGGPGDRPTAVPHVPAPDAAAAVSALHGGEARRPVPAQAVLHDGLRGDHGAGSFLHEGPRRPPLPLRRQPQNRSEKTQPNQADEPLPLAISGEEELATAAAPAPRAL